MRSPACCIAAVALTFASVVSAEYDAPDVAPAATLLLPYFEVGLDDATSEVNTVFTIRNVGPAAALAHVMLFTDYSVGTFAFDVYLTGFASRTIDLGALFRSEIEAGAFVGSYALARDTPVPEPPPAPTGGVFADNFETGDLGRWSVVKSRVTGVELAAYHRGAPSERTGLCAGVDHGDAIARGYVLIDNVNELAGDTFPEQDNYFPFAGGGISSRDNILWGTYELRHPNQNYAIANPMIHIEARENKSALQKGQVPTFYARYVNETETDRREPLDPAWATRYVTGGAFDGGTSLMYWRDPEVVQQAFPCGSPPSWAPLATRSVVAFDEEGNGTALESPHAFPYACGRVVVGGAALPVPYSFGWLYVNFSDVSTQGGSRNQAALLATYAANGRFAIGQGATSFDSVPEVELDKK